MLKKNGLVLYMAEFSCAKNGLILYNGTVLLCQKWPYTVYGTLFVPNWPNTVYGTLFVPKMA